MRRAVSATTCFLFLVATIGLPMPELLPSPSNGEDFPCRGHGCGCVSAEMCRTNCCCIKPKLEPKKGCCGSSKNERLAKGDDASDDENQSSHTTVAKLSPLQCKGLSTHWVAVSLLSSSEHRICVSEAKEFAGHATLPSITWSPQSDTAPPSPPPRA